MLNEEHISLFIDLQQYCSNIEIFQAFFVESIFHFMLYYMLCIEEHFAIATNDIVERFDCSQLVFPERVADLFEDCFISLVLIVSNSVILQPKWNHALLEMFRIDYIGNSPYINCLPSLHHHTLGSRDKFLILSSDGLYQYFTNEEAVSEVETFLSIFPEGDPAQHLVEEVLFRAAKKAGKYKTLRIIAIEICEVLMSLIKSF